MSKQPEKVTFPLKEGPYDEVIDVRSPSEFAEDHITGAVNLPVLDDEERVEVGTIYKQVSSFDARKIGAAKVSRNIASHLETHFADKPKEYRPLVYCWRGGQRSGSLATVLSDIGWNVSLIDGGYKAYRAEVVNRIEQIAGRLRLVVLNGYTGAGKTLVLKALQKKGVQVLELEGMASHKGSVFGGDPKAPQPAQKRFESLLHDELTGLDLEKPVFVEAESAKIGRLNLPNPLWQQMKSSPVIEIASPLSARADYLTDDYEEWLGDLERIEATVNRLQGFHPNETIASWKALAVSGKWRELVEELLRDHYDKKYTVGGTGNYGKPELAIELPRHNEASVKTCADAVIEAGRKLLSDRSVGGKSS